MYKTVSNKDNGVENSLLTSTNSVLNSMVEHRIPTRWDGLSMSFGPRDHWGSRPSAR